MRVLSDEELTIFFQKLKKYLGSNINYLIENSEDDSEKMVFRLIKTKVYYLSSKMLK